MKDRKPFPTYTNIDSKKLHRWKRFGIKLWRHSIRFQVVTSPIMGRCQKFYFKLSPPQAFPQHDTGSGSTMEGTRGGNPRSFNWFRNVVGYFERNKIHTPPGLTDMLSRVHVPSCLITRKWDVVDKIMLVGSAIFVLMTFSKVPLSILVSRVILLQARNFKFPLAWKNFIDSILFILIFDLSKMLLCIS